MTNLKKLIRDYENRIEYFSHSENVQRYTKHMEGGERREFAQNREDDKLILAALKEQERRHMEESTKREVVPRKGCSWCMDIGRTPQNWECSLVSDYGTVTTADNDTVI